MPPPAPTTPAAPMPTLFLAHGAPVLLDLPDWVEALALWGHALPRPRAILVISAHWLERPATLGATRAVPLVYDFDGFPAKYYRQRYAAPGAPALAQRVRELLAPLGPVSEEPERGLDHGAYVPLVAMYPAADVPVLQLSLPTLEPAALFRLGQALEPLRREGVLIIGSGFLTHNMHSMDFSPAARPPGWASDFDAWAAEALSRRDVDALLSYRERAPDFVWRRPTNFAPTRACSCGSQITSGDPLAGVVRRPVIRRAADRHPPPLSPRNRLDLRSLATQRSGAADSRGRTNSGAPAVRTALPTVEHFVPLLVALGAAAEGPVSFPITGFFAGSFSKRSVQLGGARRDEGGP